MGRRPNAIISEWFSRGAKLDDASNRYAHTCRRCGELFAKGRVEYLMQHLLKRCPNITTADRSAILQQMQQTPAPKPSNRSSQRARDELNRYAGVDTTLPIALERQQSALDTLAEVSRHHLDYSVQRQLPVDHTQFNSSDQDLAEQALWAQLQQHTMNLPAQGDSGAFDMTSTAQNHDIAYTSESFAAGLVQSVQETQQDFSHTQNPYPLAFAQLDPQLGHDTSTNFDTDMAAEPYTHPVTSMSNPTSEEMQETPESHYDSSKQVFVKYTPNNPQSDADINRTTGQARLRPRGRFSETRRKEVQEIRKRGACIRCRMLKKPCSEGTPCRTCANVDVARLWKGKCLRTKLCDEFTAWSYGFFRALWARSNSDRTTEEIVMPSLDLEIFFLSPSSQTSSINVVVPVSVQETSDDIQGNSLVLESTDSSAEQLAQLCTAPDVLEASVHFYAHNSLIATTIQEARNQCGLTNLLLYNTLQLWVVTNILTDWHGQESLLSFQLRSRAATDMESRLAELASQNHESIRMQVFAVLEKKAARLCKAVLTDIERHLLQRQQVSSYTTFLAAVILLDCVERTTTFYHAFDSTQPFADSSTTREDWPLLSTTPVSVWSQGPAFAQLLQMLLRMRGLPPRTIEDENGILAVRDESSDNISKLNGSVSEVQLRAQDEERRQALTEWLRRSNVGAREVKSWLEPDHGWHGKFVAGILIDDSTADTI